MIEATSMTVSYREDEDRLLIICSNDTKRCSLWLTRRITERLLSTFADLIERINPALGKVPADMRNEMIAFEHQSAMIQTRETAAPAPTGQDDCGVALVTKVNVKATPDAFQLTFYAPASEVARFTGMRANFHKTLASLNQCAAAGDWKLGGSIEWLQQSEPAQGKGRLAS